MQGQHTRFRIVLCVVAMAAIGLVVLIWWRLTWITVVLLVVGLTCLAAMLYAWAAGRRIDQLLQKDRRASPDMGSAHFTAHEGRDQRIDHAP